MNRPERGKAARRALGFLLLLARDRTRWRAAKGKLAAAWRAGGPLGVLERIRLKLHWGSVRYSTWVRFFDDLRPTDRRAIARRLERLRRPPISVVLCVAGGASGAVGRSVESVELQLYAEWELILVPVDPVQREPLEAYAAREGRVRVLEEATGRGWAASMNAALDRARGEFVVLLDAGDELAVHALYLVAEELNAHPDADLVYSDEDRLDERGRRVDPIFKPDWNPDLLTAHNYIARLAAYRTELVRRAGGFREKLKAAADYDLCLRCVAATSAERILHLPHVLYHRRVAAQRAPDGAAGEAGRQALVDFLSRREPGATVEPGRLPGTYRVRRPLPSPPPLATLIIPTRDGLALLRRCVESIQRKTTYPSYEILIVDNQSRDPSTLSYFEELRRSGQAEILSYDHPFNYSAINNLAVEQARGELIGLLNNDIEVLSPEWLSEMAAQALRPEIGAVGAKLYYPDGRIQHAGVIVGLGGLADHGHRHFPRDAPGYMGRLQVAQNLSAVTAACLVMRRALYQQVGGLDAEHLAVSFNDVDLCLRLGEARYRNLWTPDAELIHHESVTRGAEDTPEKQAREAREIAFMRLRWGSRLLRDPCYSQALTLDSEDFSLAWPPRRSKPWQ